MTNAAVVEIPQDIITSALVGMATVCDPTATS
jgi:hypothetical protein